MRIPRCYVNAPLRSGDEIELDERTHRHLVQVLRLRPGSGVILFNGLGGAYESELIRAERRQSRVRLGKFLPGDTCPALSVTLIQGIARGERMDFILQKATELGISRIQPVLTRRTMATDTKERLEKRMAHWLGVLISACEQSGRNEIPELLPAVTLDRWLDDHRVQPGLRLTLDPRAEHCLPGLGMAPESVQLLIGPEGGLEKQEVDQAAQCGFLGIRLGPRILRTETAGLAALAAIQTLWGDMR